jgi:hypothetical protein
MVITNLVHSTKLAETLHFADGILIGRNATNIMNFLAYSWQLAKLVEVEYATKSGGTAARFGSM